MKVYCYKSNIYSVQSESLLYVMATSKAQALKFAKQFDGLLIGERLKTINDYTMFDNSDELMKGQAEQLKKRLNDKKVILVNTDLKLK